MTPGPAIKLARGMLMHVYADNQGGFRHFPPGGLLLSQQFKPPLSLNGIFEVALSGCGDFQAQSLWDKAKLPEPNQLLEIQ